MQKIQKVGLVVVLMVLGGAVIVRYPGLIFFPFSFLLGEPSNNTPFIVSSTADDRPVLTFLINNIDFSRDPLRSISFDEISFSNPTKGTMVWALINQGNAVKLYTLVYGECPPGYKETVKPQALVPGHYYRVNSEVLKKVAPCKFEVLHFHDFLELAKRYQIPEGRLNKT